jgi:hypothetical protein
VSPPPNPHGPRPFTRTAALLLVFSSAIIFIDEGLRRALLTMRLAVLAPTLPAELAALLPLLARLDPPVLTSRSLLFTPAHALLQGLLETPRDGAARRTPRESALKQLQQAVRRAEAPPMILGTTAYDDELVSRRQRPGLTTGIGELDRLLSTVSNVIELSGPEGAGKTVRARLLSACVFLLRVSDGLLATQLLALHLAIRHLLAVPTARVLWVDSEGVFGAERALAVLQAIDPSAVRRPRTLLTLFATGKRLSFLTSQPPETVLDRLEVRATFDLTTFGEVLASLEAQLSTAATSAASVSDLLLVVDPIDGLYGGGMATNGLESGYSTNIVDSHSRADLSDVALQPRLRWSQTSTPCQPSHIVTASTFS